MVPEDIKHYKKEYVYEQYIRIIERFKPYEKVSKTQMLKEIYNYYQNYENILDICTTRELKYLKKVLNNEEIDKHKFKWESRTLYDKFILLDEYENYIISEPIKEYVIEALKMVDWTVSKEKDRINEFLVSYTCIQGYMLTYNLIQLGSTVLNLDINTIEQHILNNSVFRYYVYNTYKYFQEFNEDIVISVYNNFYDYVDQINERRKKLKITPSMNINVDDLKELFYNDFNLKNPIIKKFLKEFDELPSFSFLALPLIRISVLLNDDREELKKSIRKVPALSDIDLENIFKLMDDAMDEMPSAVLNGLTRNQYKMLLQDKINREIENEKKYIIQRNACLNDKDAKLFYKLYFGLLDFTNQKYQINPKLKIYKKLRINPNDVAPIVEQFWENKDKLIDEFCNINQFKFKDDELKLIEEFKKGIRDIFIVMKFEEEYTAVMNTSKVYMIKGINSNIDEIIDYRVLPHVTRTTVIPFKDYLIYDSIFMSLQINLDKSFLDIISKEYENTMKYYHI